MSHQITLDLPDEVYRPLLEKAKVTWSELGSGRQRLPGQGFQSQGRVRALRRWAGAFSSDVPDAGIRHDDYLEQALLDELRGKSDA